MRCGELYLTEGVEYSEYGYWVTPDGAAITVADSKHFQTLLRHYRGEATFSQDRYGHVVDEGWVWVNVSGSFLCFYDPRSITKATVVTLIQIINLYPEFEQFRFVVMASHTGQSKQDFDSAADARRFLRSLVAVSA